MALASRESIILLYVNKPLQQCHRYMNIFLSTWGLTVGGMIFAAPMVYLRVKDHTNVEDETL
jgi:hypothetical protein